MTGSTALGERLDSETLRRVVSRCDAMVLSMEGRADETWAQLEHTDGLWRDRRHLVRELSSEDDFASQNAWRLAAALVASARGKHERATSLVDDALEIIDNSDYLGWQAEGREVRGRVLEAAGRHGESHAFGGGSPPCPPDRSRRASGASPARV